MLTAAKKRVESKPWLLIFVPIIFLAGLIFYRSVNIPFWDEWELVPIFQHIHSGHLLFSDFWQQHNEHRLFFPTILLVGLSYLTHWNLRVELFASLAVATGSFLLIKAMFSKYGINKYKNVLLLLLALIWFSPVQIENWQWGWQIEWFMNILGVCLVAFAISRARPRHLSKTNLGLITIGALLAQYSLGNGTIIWPIAVIILVYLRTEIIKTAAVALIGTISTILYYTHYSFNTGEPSKTVALHKPLQFIEYVLAYLGRTLSFLHKPALAIGAILIVSFASITCYLFIKHKEQLVKALPWIALSLYAIGSAVLTGLARLGFGVSEAYSSRYTTVSQLLLISLIILFWQNRSYVEKLIKDKRKVFMPVVTVGVASLVLIEFFWGIHASNTQYNHLKAAQQCTHKASASASCLLLIYPNAQIVRSRLDYIKSQNIGGY